YFVGKHMKSALPDFASLFEQCTFIVEHHQSLALAHSVEGKTYRLSVTKMRNGVLIRLSE
ncbi:MAG: hypothetical protein RML40_06085, partial [Bacteroidota bacterium]|nr:hypothetical protein [Candidatus Kapabacteria bacterium]MDW8220083.1 hypothetical protein [Bacteroidota bacterium]